MVEIEVDFEVFKQLTLRRRSEMMTENDVIKELLEMGSTSQKKENIELSSDGAPWVCRGVSFPSGTRFRAQYKGREYLAEVRDGGLILRGKKYSSPSSAAVSITGNNVNGWRFWEAQLPGNNRWKLAEKFR